MTRLIAGSAGGRRLKVPASGVRPTGDRAREGLFNSLGSLLDLDGARVLDLYAGSGALGLEALSRGAAEVVFVESGARVLPVLRANLGAVGLPGGRVIAGSRRGPAGGRGRASGRGRRRDQVDLRGRRRASTEGPTRGGAAHR